MSDESLMNEDAGAGETQETTPPGDQETSEQHAWFWADDMQGEGDAPDYLIASKYKSVADQAKGYNEIRKTLGAFTGAPEEGKYEHVLPEGFELPEGVEAQLDPEDPLAQEFSKWAAENNVSQEKYSELLAMYMTQQVNDYNARGETAEAEMGKLGDNGAARIESLAKWGRANMDEEIFEKFRSSLTSADAVEAYEFIIGKTRNAQLPDPTNINPNLKESQMQELKELQAAKDQNGQLLWFKDPNHRAKIEHLQKQIYGQEEHREVVG